MLSLHNPYTWLIAAALASGGYVSGRLHAWHNQTLQAAAERAEASEAARETERHANRSNTRINDARQKADQAALVANAAAARRLRQLAAARSEAAAACSRLDEPAAGVLPDRTREDLESLAQRANAEVRSLRGLQQYIREVVAPTCNIEFTKGGRSPPGITPTAVLEQP